MNYSVILLGLAACLLPVAATAVQVGDELPAFELSDQHGKQHQLGDTVRRIYANDSRSADKLMKQALEELKQAALDNQQAIAVADVSAAPGFVKRIIRSSLKDRDYITWMDTKGSTGKFLPYREDRVSVIELDQRRITAIRYVSSLNELRAELTQLPPSAPPSPAPDASAPDTNDNADAPQE